MTALERALEALNRGNPLAGERIVTDAAKIAAQSYGAGSVEAAEAHFEASQFFHAAAKPEQVVAELREAAKLVPKTDEQAAARFGYWFHLAAALDRAGDLAESESVLRQLVVELDQAYGELHSATATGQTALSGVLFEQGEIEEALDLIEGAVRTLHALDDPGLAPALALRAFVIKAYSPVEASFPGEIDLDAELVEALVNAALERVPQAAPQLALLALSDVESLAEAVLGETHAARRAVLAQCVHTAAAAGDDDAQMRALDTMFDLARRGGDELGQADISLAMAEAHAAAGRQPEAHAAFERAAATAGSDARMLALGLARHAQYRAALGEDEQAQALIERSVEAARESRDSTLIGSCLTTQGVLMQHAGLEHAAHKLEAALDLLQLGHPDADIATEHLEALEAGRPCGCFGDAELLSAVAEALNARLPDGLLRGVVQDVDGFRVDLARQPSEAEHELVQSVLNEVMAELAQPSTS